MKKIILLATAFVFTLGAMAQETTTTVAAKPTPDEFIKVKMETHDFGKIKQGVPVEHNFVLVNISKTPVVIENTWAGCGCTTPERIVEPILPNATAKLKVQFNAAAVGPINKEVFIKIAGVEQPKTIRIVGEVLTTEAYDEMVKTQPVKEVKEPVKEVVKPTQSKTGPKIQSNPNPTKNN
jgi:hypothetical protein